MNRKIDSHKLHLHPERVLAWKNGDQIYPIYVEMSPTSICNLKCSFCALDFMKRGKQLDIDGAKTAIAEMKQLGVKSIMFAGEGEPLLYPKFIELAQHAKKCGIDIALTTNGTMLNSTMAYALLPIMSWIKISLSSVVPTTFAKIGGVDRHQGMKVLGTIISNIYETISIRKSFGHTCDIGIQMLHIDENHNDIEVTALVAKELGADYFVLKQYSKHPSSINDNMTPECLVDISALQDENFKVMIRQPVFGHNYDFCRAMPFWSYISSNGDVHACSSHIPDPKFVLGNIYTEALKNIWNEKRMATVQVNVDINKCRIGCRMDACNEYLHELVHPNKHVNFI